MQNGTPSVDAVEGQTDVGSGSRALTVVSESSPERITFYLDIRINRVLIIVESIVNSHGRPYYFRNTSRYVIEIPRNKKYPRCMKVINKDNRQIFDYNDIHEMNRRLA